MKCHELVRILSERGITLSLRGDGRVRASPPEEAAPLVEDMKRYRRVMLAIAAGTYKDESFRGAVRKARIACPDLLNDGQCHGCFMCEWHPVWVDGEGPSGVCVARGGEPKQPENPEWLLSGPEKNKRRLSE